MMKDAGEEADDDDILFYEGAIRFIRATEVLTPDPWQTPMLVTSTCSVSNANRATTGASPVRD